MEWWDDAQEYDSQTWAHAGRLESLSADWQRELVALERAQRHINNGGDQRQLEFPPDDN
jgi:hypothetical protein